MKVTARERNRERKEEVKEGERKEDKYPRRREKRSLIFFFDSFNAYV